MSFWGLDLDTSGLTEISFDICNIGIVRSLSCQKSDSRWAAFSGSTVAFAEGCALLSHMSLQKIHVIEGVQMDILVVG